jgi:hypothetical protein
VLWQLNGLFVPRCFALLTVLDSWCSNASGPLHLCLMPAALYIYVWCLDLYPCHAHRDYASRVFSFRQVRREQLNTCAGVRAIVYSDKQDLLNYNDNDDDDDDDDKDKDEDGNNSP